MKRALQVILVVGAMVALASLAAWGLAVWFLGPYLLWAPVGIHVSAETPESVAVGDSIEMTVRVRNDGPEGRTLSAITIEMDLLRGFAVEGVQPPFTASEPATEHRVYRFDTPIPAGRVTPIRFSLRATGQGVDEGQSLRQGRIEVLFEDESRISSTSASIAIRER